MSDQQPEQRTDADGQASAAQHALADQRREEQRAQTTPEPQDPQHTDDADNADDGSALGPENSDPVSEASAESFPASDPPATSSPS